MNTRTVTFCEQINDLGRIIDVASMDDLPELTDRALRTGHCSFSLSRTGDRDSGIELITTPEGTAIFGCEDSQRGIFSFYCDPSKTPKLVPIEIYEVPHYALCDNLENAMQIAEVFFREGELDRRFSSMINVSIGDTVKRDNLIAAGDRLPIAAYIARVAQEQTA